MNNDNTSPKDIQETLLYLFFISLGVIFILLSFLIVKHGIWSSLLLSIGATLISTSLVFFLYQSFGTQNTQKLLKQIDRIESFNNQQLVEQLDRIESFNSQQLVEQLVEQLDRIESFNNQQLDRIESFNNQQLVEQLDRIESSNNEKFANLIDKIQQYLNITKKTFELGICDMWLERRHIQSTYWNDFTKSAHEVWLFGIAELQYAQDITFQRIISQGTDRGCRYRILLLNPKSDAAEKLDQIEKGGGGGEVQGRINRALGVFQSLKHQNQNKPGTIEIRVCSKIPHVNIVRADSELLVTQYMPPLLGYELFTIRVKKVTGGIFSQYKKYFEDVWEESQIWQEKQS